MRRLMSIYLLTFFSFSKSSTMSISKKRKSWKGLASKTSLTRKRWSIYVLKCLVPKPKAYLSKISKSSWHCFSKIWLCLIKSMKNGSQMKSFQSNVNTLVRGHICSFLQVRQVTWLRASCIWLDWIDHWNFILDYGLLHTWFTHTTYKSNVPWIPISFV